MPAYSSLQHRLGGGRPVQLETDCGMSRFRSDTLLTACLQAMATCNRRMMMLPAWRSSSIGYSAPVQSCSSPCQLLTNIQLELLQ